jgi:hypothetical protein
MTAHRPLLNILKLKRVFHRWTVSAPRVTIRQTMPLPMRAIIGLGILAGIGGIAFGGYDIGRSFAGGHAPNTASKVALAQNSEPVAKIQAERDRLASTANSAESQINIERSLQRQLAAQVKLLETENSKLKEDLAFFESLLPADRTGGSVSIRRLKADVAGTGQLRYRLLVMQGGKGDRDFSGSLQLAVTVLQNGKSAVIVFPEAGHKDPVDTEKFQLAFKRYQRIEGLLTLPPGAEMKSVQARILEKGQLKAQQTALLEGDS